VQGTKAFNFNFNQACSPKKRGVQPAKQQLEKN